MTVTTFPSALTSWFRRTSLVPAGNKVTPDVSIFVESAFLEKQVGNWKIVFMHSPRCRWRLSEMEPSDIIQNRSKPGCRFDRSSCDELLPRATTIHATDELTNDVVQREDELAHIGFLSLNFMGHLYPMSSLALHLKGRGHRTTFFSFADSEAFITETGLECIVFGQGRFPVGYRKRASDALGRMHGLAGLRYTIELLCNEVGAQLAELPKAIRKAKIDALVIDQFLLGGSSVAEHLKLPYVHVANALLGNVDTALPPISFGWGNDRNLFALVRNWAAHAFLREIARPIRDQLNAQRRIWKLSLYTEFQNERFGSQPQICQQPPGFEFPERVLPQTFHFVGPLHSHETRLTTYFPWERLDGRPLIYASMGTLQNGLESVFRRIAEGCLGIEAQLVLSLGGNMDPAQFSDLPGDPVVVKFAPQLELLKRARLCITHAGLNTVLEALAQGVPMVAIPITNDQPAVAARIAWSGTGGVLPLKRLRGDSLRALAVTVIETPSHRQNARRLQTEIANLNSLEWASEIVESVVT